MAEMTISDYASIKELENEHRDGWGSTTALGAYKIEKMLRPEEALI